MPDKIWSRLLPTEEGWYWIKYRSKHGMTKCPAAVAIFDNPYTVSIHSARNDVFMSGPNNYAWDTSLRFGPKIKEPK